MSQSERAAELGAFLRARREELSPEEVGFSTGHRRTNGLRREEVAQLASISSNFYSRIEQGRRSASVSVLDAISRALLLTDNEREYVFSLAGKEDVKPYRSNGLRVHPSARADETEEHALAELRGCVRLFEGEYCENASDNVGQFAAITLFESADQGYFAIVAAFVPALNTRAGAQAFKSFLNKAKARCGAELFIDPRFAFSDKWDVPLSKPMRKRYSWDNNPMVWVLEFDRVSDTEVEHDGI